MARRFSAPDVLRAMMNYSKTDVHQNDLVEFVRIASEYAGTVRTLKEMRAVLDEVLDYEEAPLDG